MLAMAEQPVDTGGPMTSSDNIGRVSTTPLFSWSFDPWQRVKKPDTGNNPPPRPLVTGTTVRLVMRRRVVLSRAPIKPQCDPDNLLGCFSFFSLFDLSDNGGFNPFNTFGNRLDTSNDPPPQPVVREEGNCLSIFRVFKKEEKYTDAEDASATDFNDGSTSFDGLETPKYVTGNISIGEGSSENTDILGILDFDTASYDENANGNTETVHDGIVDQVEGGHSSGTTEQVVEEEIVELEFEKMKLGTHTIHCPNCDSKITKLILRRTVVISRVPVELPPRDPKNLSGCFSCFSLFTSSEDECLNIFGKGSGTDNHSTSQYPVCEEGNCIDEKNTDAEDASATDCNDGAPDNTDISGILDFDGNTNGNTETVHEDIADQWESGQSSEITIEQVIEEEVVFIEIEKGKLGTHTLHCPNCDSKLS